jgi:hypothetical protein
VLFAIRPDLSAAALHYLRFALGQLRVVPGEESEVWAVIERSLDGRTFSKVANNPKGLLA